MAVHEDRSGASRIPAKDGPVRYFSLGYEDAWHRRAECEDVEIAEMIADDEPAGREGPIREKFNSQVGKPARAATMQPRGAVLRRRRTRAQQLAVIENPPNDRNGQRDESSGLTCQPCK